MQHGAILLVCFALVALPLASGVPYVPVGNVTGKVWALSHEFQLPADSNSDTGMPELQKRPSFGVAVRAKVGSARREPPGPVWRVLLGALAVPVWRVLRSAHTIRVQTWGGGYEATRNTSEQCSHWWQHSRAAWP